jgi:5-methylcytosine-specific restriction endonuclease McrA
MDDYLKQLSHIISNGSMENTYKMSWIRSIVETCEKEPKEIIHFDELSPLIFKYYWNQSIFFKLKQGPNLKKKPKIQQLVEETIKEYKSIYGSQPKTFIKVKDKIKIPIEQISNVLTQDVSWRFLVVGKEKFNTYDYDLEKRTIKIFHPELIKEYSDILYQLINYRWTQKLEDLDGSPRISKKIRGVDRENTPKRQNLKSFHKYLDIENPERKCFITGDKIPDNKLSVDHVIPWSYMYSDDIWNLVYVNSSQNSSKNNRLPNDNMIIKLENRNIILLGLLKSKNLDNKHTGELDISINNNYVRHHWTGFKG